MLPLRYHYSEFNYNDLEDTMFEAKLFIGITVNHDIALGLSQANEYAVKTFINNDSEYLHETVRDGIRYVGKIVDQIQIDEALPLLSENIYSLLGRLLTDFEPNSNPLMMFPIKLEACETSQTPPAKTALK